MHGTGASPGLAHCWDASELRQPRQSVPHPTGVAPEAARGNGSSLNLSLRFFPARSRPSACNSRYDEEQHQRWVNFMSPNLFISAGEASGEHYGALLITAIQRRLAQKGATAKLFGMGGPRMVAAGLEQIVRAEDMAVMGVTEVALHLPRIYREYRKLRQSIRNRRPDAAVLIDFPDIHFKLAQELHKLGIPVIYFVSPQLWAWKKHRIELVRRFVRRMLVIFPFEEAYYRDRGIQAEFVGHPLADLPLPTITREEFAAKNGLHPERIWIALLPGSRMKEIEDHLPEMVEAAWKLSLPHPSAAHPNETYEFVVPLAPTLTAAQRTAVYNLAEQRGGGLAVRIVDDARAALLHARASVVASGTATVEAALIGNPFLVVYRVSPMTYAVARKFVDVPHVAMANLIAGKRLVPELIQHDFTAENIVQQLNRLLPDGPPRESMMEELKVIRNRLIAPSQPGAAGPPGAIERVAAVVEEELHAAVQAESAKSARS
jgi:lipid-A-disaccharide synthase